MSISAELGKPETYTPTRDTLRREIEELKRRVEALEGNPI